ncbi:MAG TPA: hypothetical protein VIH42_03170 [Thermoguttaceae bacterium]
MSSQTPLLSESPENCPVAWFAVLERARLSSDFELAAKAQHELERLGVSVKFHRKNRQRHKGIDHGQ